MCADRGRGSFRRVLRPLVLGLLMLLTGQWLAAQAPEVPRGVPARPTAFISDLAGVLPPAERAALEQRLRRFRDSTSNEIAVLIAPGLPEGEVLEDYVNQVARAWGVGDRKQSNGVLIAVFVVERRARIEVGYGLEPVINDAAAGRIIREQMGPAFKRGDYAAGLQAAVAELEQRARKEFNTPKKRRNKRDDGNLIVALIVVLAIIGVVALIYANDRRSYHARHRRDRRREGDYTDYGGGWFFWGGHWGGGGGSGSSSGSDWGGGSDFGGFGGGDFGGGGASGDW